MRLQQLFTGEITHREMINLIRQLPSGCRLDRQIRGEEAEWGLNEYLLRAATNALIAANYQRAQKRAPSSSFIEPPSAKKTKKAVQPAGGAAELDKLFTG